MSEFNDLIAEILRDNEPVMRKSLPHTDPDVFTNYARSIDPQVVAERRANRHAFRDAANRLETLAKASKACDPDNNPGQDAAQPDDDEDDGQTKLLHARRMLAAAVKDGRLSVDEAAKMESRLLHAEKQHRAEAGASMAKALAGVDRGKVASYRAALSASAKAGKISGEEAGRLEAQLHSLGLA